MTPDTPLAEDGLQTHPPGRAEKLEDQLVASLSSAWIPSLPEVLLRVLAVADDRNAGLDELAELINRDPGLCARVLTVANSPALRRGAEMRRIEDCVMVLGTRFVRTMAACLAVKTAFDDVAGRVHCDLAAFWRHSLEVAELTRAVAVATGYANPDEAYLAGLLHDTGELLLLTSDANYTRLLLDAGSESGLCDLERHSYGADHGAVGAWLVNQWHIDSFLGDAILFHHRSYSQLADADALTRILWASHAATTATDGVSDEAGWVVGLDPDGLASLRAEARQHTGGIATALGIASDFPGTLPVPAARDRSQSLSPIASAALEMAYAQPLQQGLVEATSEDEMLLMVRETAGILFGLDRMAVLAVDETRRALRGIPVDTQPALLRQLEIPMSSPSSLVAKAAATSLVLCGLEKLEAQVSLADMQILRLLGSESLLALPLAGKRPCGGVIVFGISLIQWQRLAHRKNALANFGRIVAASFDASRAVSEREKAAVDRTSQLHRQHARRIAHEAGNPLGIIRNYLSLLAKKLDGEAAVVRQLAFIDEEISRVARIVEDAGDRDIDYVEPSRCDVGSLITELLAGYGVPLFASRGIDVVQVAKPGTIAAVRRDPLLQVLLNLWKNASEAMPKGGKYSIELIPGVYEGSRRLIDVRLRDDGPGLSPETWKRLTADHGSASGFGQRGQGLGIVAKLVAAMGGRILCANPTDGGTLFSLHLPAAED